MRDRDQFDDLLDGALKEYGSVEPRVGLEGRVLANLATAELRVSNRRIWTWRWSLAACVTACVLVAVWGGLYTSRETRPIHVAPRTLNAARVPEATNDKMNKDTSKRTATALAPTVRPRQIKRVSHQPQELATHREPRLAQFPSPQPLSAQEIMLLEYVRRYPADAKLVAKEQAEFQERIEQAQKRLGNDSNANE